MSLPNLKNLVSPVTNKVHLVSILFLAAAFAMFRLSGGNLHVRSSQPGSSYAPQAQPAEPAAQPHVNRAARPSGISLDADEGSDAALDTKPSAPAKTTAHAQPDDLFGSAEAKDGKNAGVQKDGTDKGRSLESLEKSLGLK